MGLDQTAARLGVRHRTLRFESCGLRMWRHRPTAPWSCVEAAALAYFAEAEGWEGHDGEGGLILSLIKAASFPTLVQRHRSTYIEALYAQNVAFAEDRFNVEWLLHNVRSATPDRIRTNFAVMAVSQAGTPEFFPTVTLSKMVGLFSALGAGRLHAIASLFAKAPYELRRGWPDLTLWRGDRVAFREIKTSGDTFRRVQRRLIAAVLKPLGHDVEIVEVSGVDPGQAT